MNGSFTYGPFGRLLSVLAGIVAVIGTLEAQGTFNLLPLKYKWIGAVMTALGVGITVFSERAQGGASSPRVRYEAEQSDVKNASETQGRDLHDRNC
jgi:hypothetical protein